MDLRSNHPEQLRWLAQSFSDVSAVHGFGTRFQKVAGALRKAADGSTYSSSCPGKRAHGDSEVIVDCLGERAEGACEPGNHLTTCDRQSAVR